MGISDVGYGSIHDSGQYHQYGQGIVVKEDKVAPPTRIATELDRLQKTVSDLNDTMFVLFDRLEHVRYSVESVGQQSDLKMPFANASPTVSRIQTASDSLYDMRERLITLLDELEV